ncbi:MGMT family protein [Patescibacteria group bacterium]|nr:MGMT family protein [Patescibacteria group bacterium]MBU1890452.1 MGMT family protein [Patescibacteria group bacterium]
MTFYDQVKALTKRIPHGKVASYGQIVALTSTPRAARVVGWALHTMDVESGIPWHRVINSKGYISTTCPTHTANLQKQLLTKEGVTATKRNGLWWIDMKNYQWQN